MLPQPGAHPPGEGNGVGENGKKPIDRLTREETIRLLWARDSRNGRSFRNRCLDKQPRWSEDNESFFLEEDITKYFKQAKRATKELGFFAHYASFGIVRKPLRKEFHEERLRLLALSFMPCDHKNPKHVQLLQEVYLLYTGKEKKSVVSKGEHWKELGFRTADPTVTFKTGGLLALWMMLAFYKHNKELALKTFRESKATEGGYPFPALCDRMTEFVIRVLRKGKLNCLVGEIVPEESSSKRGVHRHRLIHVAQKLFVGFVYKFHLYMRETDDVTQAKKRTEAYLRRDLSILLKIADIPDILYLNEDLFVKATVMKQLKNICRVSCVCGSSDRFSDYEDFAHD